MTGLRRRAFTLVEVVVSLVGLSLVFLALGSVLMLTLRAAPMAGDTASLVQDGAWAMERMADDLAAARPGIVIANSQLEAQVPDRTGDDTDDTVVYDWTSGALVRTVNAGASETLVESLARMQISLKGPRGTGGSLVSMEHAAPSYSPLHDGIGVGIRPVFNCHVTSWTVTAVSVDLGATGAADGIAWIFITGANASWEPTGRVLAKAAIFESEVPAQGGLYRVELPEGLNFNDGNALCVIVEPANGSSRMLAGFIDEFDATVSKGLNNNFFGGYSGSSQGLRVILHGTVDGDCGVRRHVSAKIDLDLDGTQEGQLVREVTLVNETGGGS